MHRRPAAGRPLQESVAHRRATSTHHAAEPTAPLSAAGHLAAAIMDPVVEGAITQRARQHFAAPPPPLTVICPPIGPAFRSIEHHAARAAALEASAKSSGADVAGLLVKHDVSAHRARLPAATERSTARESTLTARLGSEFQIAVVSHVATNRSEVGRGAHENTALEYPQIRPPELASAVDGEGEPSALSQLHNPHHVSNKLFELHAAMQRFHTSADIALLNLGMRHGAEGATSSEGVAAEESRRWMKLLDVKDHARETIELLTDVLDSQQDTMSRLGASDSSLFGSGQRHHQQQPQQYIARPASPRRGGSKAEEANRLEPKTGAPVPLDVGALRPTPAVDAHAGGGRPASPRDDYQLTNLSVDSSNWGDGKPATPPNALPPSSRGPAPLRPSPTDAGTALETMSDAETARRALAASCVSLMELQAVLQEIMRTTHALTNVATSSVLSLASHQHIRETSNGVLRLPSAAQLSATAEKLERLSQRLRSNCLTGLHAVHDAQDAFADMAGSRKTHRGDELVAATSSVMPPAALQHAVPRSPSMRSRGMESIAAVSHRVSLSATSGSGGLNPVAPNSSSGTEFLVAIEADSLEGLARTDVERSELERDVAVMGAIVCSSAHACGGTVLRDHRLQDMYRGDDGGHRGKGSGKGNGQRGTASPSAAIPYDGGCSASWIVSFPSAAEAVAWERGVQLVAPAFPWSVPLLASRQGCPTLKKYPIPTSDVPYALSSVSPLDFIDSNDRAATAAAQRALQLCETAFTAVFNACVEQTTWKRRMVVANQMRDDGPTAAAVGHFATREEEATGIDVNMLKGACWRFLRTHVHRGLRFRSSLHAVNFRSEAAMYRKLPINVPLCTAAALSCVATGAGFVGNSTVYSAHFLQFCGVSHRYLHGSDASAPRLFRVLPMTHPYSMMPTAAEHPPQAEGGDYDAAFGAVFQRVETGEGSFLRTVGVDVFIVGSWDQARRGPLSPSEVPSPMPKSPLRVAPPTAQRRSLFDVPSSKLPQRDEPLATTDRAPVVDLSHFFFDAAALLGAVSSEAVDEFHRRDALFSANRFNRRPPPHFAVSFVASRSTQVGESDLSTMLPPPGFVSSPDESPRAKGAPATLSPPKPPLSRHGSTSRRRSRRRSSHAGSGDGAGGSVADELSPLKTDGVERATQFDASTDERYDQSPFVELDTDALSYTAELVRLVREASKWAAGTTPHAAGQPPTALHSAPSAASSSASVSNYEAIHFFGLPGSRRRRSTRASVSSSLGHGGLHPPTPPPGGATTSVDVAQVAGEQLFGNVLPSMPTFWDEAAARLLHDANEAVFNARDHRESVTPPPGATATNVHPAFAPGNAGTTSVGRNLNSVSLQEFSNTAIACVVATVVDGLLHRAFADPRVMTLLEMRYATAVAPSRTVASNQLHRAARRGDVDDADAIEHSSTASLSTLPRGSPFKVQTGEVSDAAADGDTNQREQVRRRTLEERADMAQQLYEHLTSTSMSSA